MITLEVNNRELQFEHSLVSLSDWEAHYEKPFYSPKKDEQKTGDELLKYFELMLIGKSKKHRHLVLLLTKQQMDTLAQYISSAKTATTVKEIQTKAGPQENVTSELIYYWLVQFRIPFKPTDEWHLNRLLMLVKVASAKQAPPPKKSSQNQVKLAMSMREINEQRKREMGTSG